jgi:hypothetical protein
MRFSSVIFLARASLKLRGNEMRKARSEHVRAGASSPVANTELADTHAHGRE